MKQHEEPTRSTQPDPVPWGLFITAMFLMLIPFICLILVIR